MRKDECRKGKRETGEREISTEGRVGRIYRKGGTEGGRKDGMEGWLVSVGRWVHPT